MYKINFLKLGVSLLLAFFISLTFLGCEDKSYLKQVYNKQLFSQTIKCLKLQLSPYNENVYNDIKNIYNFSNNCTTTLKIQYKTNIGCNSPHSTNTQGFHSYIELNLIEEDKTYYIMYKDLKDENISDEIKEAFDYLKTQVKFNTTK